MIILVNHRHVTTSTFYLIIILISNTILSNFNRIIIWWKFSARCFDISYLWGNIINILFVRFRNLWLILVIIFILRIIWIALSIFSIRRGIVVIIWNLAIDFLIVICNVIGFFLLLKSTVGFFLVRSTLISFCTVHLMLSSATVDKSQGHQENKFMIEINLLWEHQESNQGPLCVKRERYPLCYVAP